MKRRLVGSAALLFVLILAGGLFAALLVAERRSLFVVHNTNKAQMRLKVTAARTTVIHGDLAAGAWRFGLKTIDGDGLLSVDCALAGQPVVTTQSNYASRGLPVVAIITLPNCANPDIADWP